MLIKCTNCHKTLEVDETKLTKEIVRGNCPACNTIIEVKRSKANDFQPEPPLNPPNAALQSQTVIENQPAAPPMEFDDAQQFAPSASTPNKPSRTRGVSIGTKMLFLFSAFILITGGGISILYKIYVPSLMNDQIRLRTFSIAQSFSGAIQEPLLVKNYLLVNQTAENNAKLPHVAYACVLNKRGIVVAGIFGDKTHFDADFQSRISKGGFPKEIPSKNRIPGGMEKSILDFTVGGQKIHDVAVAVGQTGGEVHVGIFTSDMEEQVRESLWPFLYFLGAIILVGGLCFYLAARSISIPIRELTLAAEKISSGDLDHPIPVKAGGEIGDLVASLERMRFSINSAMDRLMQQY